MVRARVWAVGRVRGMFRSTPGVVGVGRARPGRPGAPVLARSQHRVYKDGALDVSLLQDDDDDFDDV